VQHRVVVLSDLHLGMGRRPESGRYHRLEAFFFDREFSAFMDWLLEDSKGRPLRLILAGDIIDFLRIDTAPSRRGEDRQVHLRSHPRKVGLGFTVNATVWKARQVVRAHDRFFAALGRLLGHHADNELIWMAGNHDPELRLPPVRDVLREAIREACPEHPERADQRLKFRWWFHYEPGRLWVEHGNQSDPQNAFNFPMSTVQPSLPCPCYEDELDMPLGSWFQRYVFNGFGRVAFQVPAMDAQSSYTRWLFLNRPHQILGLLRSHLPLWRRLLRTCLVDHRPGIKRMAEVNEHYLDKAARAAGLGPDQLRELRALSPGSARPSEVVQALLRRAVQVGVALLGTLLLCVVLMALIVVAVLNSEVGLVLSALVLSVLLIIAVAALASGVAVWWLQSTRPNIHLRERVRGYADRVAQVMDVPVVVMGHYHSEDRYPLSNGGIYVNTGTWIPVWDPGDSLRERVQFTFADLKHDRVHLRHWLPDGQTVRRCILMED
jgi:UDP-2,3-diacylglucosamine pyrophosphatase LpxH